jgi:hypothetical protein
MQIVKTLIKTYILDTIVQQVTQKVKNNFTQGNHNANLHIIIKSGYILVGIKVYPNYLKEFSNGLITFKNTITNQHVYLTVDRTDKPNQTIINYKDIYLNQELTPYSNNEVAKRLYHEHT